MAVYQLPKSAKAAVESIKPCKDSPESLFYAVIKAPSGQFQVVTKDGGIVQASFPKKAFCFEWLEENDTSRKEAA